MLRIRLRRTGRRKAPSYRVVVAHSRDPRDGDFVEIVGHYNPAASPKTLELKEERIRHWLSVGATPSETVHRLLHSRGLIEKPPRARVTVAPAAATGGAGDAPTSEAEGVTADASDAPSNEAEGVTADASDAPSNEAEGVTDGAGDAPSSEAEGEPDGAGDAPDEATAAGAEG